MNDLVGVVWFPSTVCCCLYMGSSTDQKGLTLSLYQTTAQNCPVDLLPRGFACRVVETPQCKRTMEADAPGDAKVEAAIVTPRGLIAPQWPYISELGLQPHAEIVVRPPLAPIPATEPQT